MNEQVKDVLPLFHCPQCNFRQWHIQVASGVLILICTNCSQKLIVAMTIQGMVPPKTDKPNTGKLELLS